MAKVKQWTEDDARYARDWLQRTDIKVNQPIQADDPNALAQQLKDTLTVTDWNRMLGAIRQRKHQAASDSVRITKSELKRLRSESQSNRQHNGKTDELDRLRAECLSQAGTISRLSRDRDILTGQLRKLDGAAATIERLRTDLAARDAEVQRLKAEVARAQEKVAAAAARESGYREQISRLESRPGQDERSVKRQADGIMPNRQADETSPRADRDRRILELPELSEIKVAEILKAEGIKCSARTVGNVRRRHSIA
ncbi:hypothetical protein [Thiorhodococcus minor]|uniref:Uncharacterized protein n=1 Tax=Thiorhodococcus minor TaxID=57489 RepID=A0A6M0JYE1_9GAMM|nr:hypothetical protein [Thiorhodococcus minor]NEV61663.1 hypothetical protein [Thiorhodococcus minor]